MATPHVDRTRELLRASSASGTLNCCFNMLGAIGMMDVKMNWSVKIA